MYNPTRPDKNRDKLYEFLSLDKILFAMRSDIQNLYAQNVEILEKRAKELEDGNYEDIAGSESEMQNIVQKLTEKVGKQKAVIDQLDSGQAKDIFRNIAYEEFTQICNGHEEEDFNIAETINRLNKIGENSIERYTKLFRDMIK